MEAAGPRGAVSGSHAPRGVQPRGRNPSLASSSREQAQGAPATKPDALSTGRPAAEPDAVSGHPWRKPSHRRVRAIRDRLRLLYGAPLAQPHGHPIAELILTVLSQSTNDRNRDVAYLNLRERFPSWEAVRDAPIDQLEEAIRPGGISKIKSVRIKAILRAITATAPGYSGPQLNRSSASPRSLSLDGLEELGVPEAQHYLTALPGVGRKTAACVLLFALGMHDVPVDTHVSRVGTRLSLLRPDAPFEELHDIMLEITPRGEELELHLNLLRHGRRTCHARRPDCRGCALQRMCPSAFNVG